MKKLSYYIFLCILFFTPLSLAKDVQDLIGKKVVLFDTDFFCSYNLHVNGHVTSGCILEGPIKYDLVDTGDAKYIVFGPSTNKRGFSSTNAFIYNVEDNEILMFGIKPNEENAEWKMLSPLVTISEILDHEKIDVKEKVSNGEKISNEIDKNILQEIKEYYMESCTAEAPKKLCDCIFDNHVIFYPDKDKFLNTDVTFNYRKAKGISAPEISLDESESLLDPLVEIMGICYAQ